MSLQPSARGTRSLTWIDAQWRGAPAGTSALEFALALALIGIILALSWGWQGSLTTRRVQNAAYLLQGDLRLTQQTAVSDAGAGPQAELCFRSNGYDIYAINYLDPVGRTSPVAGGIVKSVNAGGEYAKGLTFTPDGTATYACTADATRNAIVYLASGAPKFPDTSTHSITVALGGRTTLVNIQPTTGLATAGQ